MDSDVSVGTQTFWSKSKEKIIKDDISSKLEWAQCVGKKDSERNRQGVKVESLGHKSSDLVSGK